MIRINNISLNKATYLKNPPEHISYHVNKWIPNEHYNRESEFTKVVDSDFYYYPNNPKHRIHKDLFKSKEYSIAIASFEYDDGFYELHFIGNRPLDLNDEEIRYFWDIIKYGNTILNGKKN